MAGVHAQSGLLHGRSFHAPWPTAAMLLSAGLLVVRVPLDVRGFRPFRARGGHVPRCELPAWPWVGSPTPRNQGVEGS